jgi:hypothetical protein
LAALLSPRGRGLAVGPVSAVAVSTLLTRFPQLSLNLVLANHAVERLSLEHAPGWASAIRTDRLTVFQRPLAQVLGAMAVSRPPDFARVRGWRTQFDFILLDSVTASQRRSGEVSDQQLSQLLRLAPRVVLRARFARNDPTHRALAQRLETAGQPIEAIFPTQPDLHFGSPSIWYVSTYPLTLCELDHLAPADSLAGRAAHMELRWMLQHGVRGTGLLDR